MPDLSAPKQPAEIPFTVYQDAYYPTETAAYAHVLLPAAVGRENWNDDQLRAGGDALSCASRRRSEGRLGDIRRSRAQVGL